jgi:hypothetical protein
MYSRELERERERRRWTNGDRREKNRKKPGFSLFVIVNAKLECKGFAHLSMQEHINPQDRMRVAPALELIGSRTSNEA